jgi:DNA invertase Pin-like site-specific DNA recombinase
MSHHTEKKYICYFRVSTQEQGKSGLGIQAQEKYVKEITDNGVILKSFTEVESGKRNNRPMLLEAIRMCKDNNATLVVAKLDRLSRNVYFISSLMESKVKFICADFKEVDNFTLHIFASLAERERVMISERTAAGLNSIKVRIEKNGFHVTKNGRIISSLGNPEMQDPEKAKILMAEIAKKRTYVKKSNVGIELIKAYSQNNVPKVEIQRRLLENGISLSLKSIYKYAV